MKKAAKKKAARGRSRAASAKKAPAADLREVRQKVTNLVSGMAPQIALAVAEDVEKKAQVQSMKALFEMIGLFPEGPEEKQLEDDQALARVLLQRLGLSDEPVLNEEEANEQRELEESALAVMSAPSDPVK